MNCERARDALLEAEPADLVPGGASELTRHLASCPRCARRAAAIHRGQLALSAALAAGGPQGTADRAVRAAQAAARRAPISRAWRIAVPLTLAAGIAALVVVWRAGQQGEPATTARFTPEPALPPLAVEAPPGRTVSVFQTDNPNIVVIWYF
jgi:anti-sigma factor RsiW